MMRVGSTSLAGIRDIVLDEPCRNLVLLRNSGLNTYCNRYLIIVQCGIYCNTCISTVCLNQIIDTLTILCDKIIRTRIAQTSVEVEANSWIACIGIESINNRRSSRVGIIAILTRSKATAMHTYLVVVVGNILLAQCQEAIDHTWAICTTNARMVYKQYLMRENSALGVAILGQELLPRSNSTITTLILQHLHRLDIVALNLERCIRSYASKLLALALNLHAYTLLKAIGKQCKVEGRRLRRKRHAITTIERDAHCEALIVDYCSREFVIATIYSAILTLLHLGRSNIYVGIASNLLATVALERNALDDITVTRKLQLKPSAHISQHDIMVMARCNHNITLRVVAISHIALLTCQDYLNMLGIGVYAIALIVGICHHNSIRSLHTSCLRVKRDIARAITRLTNVLCLDILVRLVKERELIACIPYRLILDKLNTRIGIFEADTKHLGERGITSRQLCDIALRTRHKGQRSNYKNHKTFHCIRL